MVAMRPDRVERYGGAAIAFHWLTAALAIVVLTTGLRLDRWEGLELSLAVGTHAGLGLVLWALVAMRLMWRWANPVEPAASLEAWQVVASMAVHRALYALLLLQPLLGLMTALSAPYPIGVFGMPLSTFALEPSGFHLTVLAAHGLVGRLLAALALLHALAALHHLLWRRDEVFWRMMPSVRRGRPRG
jgi:cytochrome b561